LKPTKISPGQLRPVIALFYVQYFYRTCIMEYGHLETFRKKPVFKKFSFGWF